MNRDDFINLVNSNQWANAACMGYVVKACKCLDYSVEEISNLLEMLNAMFSNFTPEEYRNY